MMLTRPQIQLLRRLGKLRGRIPRQTVLTLRAQILRGEVVDAVRGLERLERRAEQNGPNAQTLV